MVYWRQFSGENMSKVIFAVLSLAVIFAGGCSNKKNVEFKREPAFFKRLINNSENYEQADRKLNELKLMVSKEKYDMRYALFDNGKFYYEVENLGHGYGDWIYKDGAINLFAPRSFFDIDIDIMAAAATGEKMNLQFIDRFGNNVVKGQLREPQAAKLPPHRPPANNSL